MTQQAISVLDLPIQATTAITEYRAVGFNGAQANVAGQKVFGIARRAAAVGQWTDVTALGTAVAEAGAAITAGQPLVTDASGRVIPATALSAAGWSLQLSAGGTPVTSVAANGAIIGGSATLAGSDLPQHIIGFALQAAAGAGEFIEILVR